MCLQSVEKLWCRNASTKCTYHLARQRSSNKDRRNLAKALSFKHIPSSPIKPKSKQKIENIHNVLKWTIRKILHGNKEGKLHEAIQIAAHNHNTFLSSANEYSPFLLHFSQKDSNPLWIDWIQETLPSCKVTSPDLYTNCTNIGSLMQLKYKWTGQGMTTLTLPRVHPWNYVIEWL